MINKFLESIPALKLSIRAIRGAITLILTTTIVVLLLLLVLGV